MTDEAVSPIPNSSARLQVSPSVEDMVDVGSPAILSSPHVSQGPGQIAKSPVPSIFADDRGDIHRLRIGGKRINLLYSKEQVMRSGYLHPHTTHDLVITGQVEVWTLGPTHTIKTVYGPHDYFSIPPYVPYILYFLQETVLVEWWDGGDGSGASSTTDCWVYHPYRKLIDIQNSITAQGVGKHSLLVPQDELRMILGNNPAESCTKSSSGGGGVRVFCWTLGGVVVGVILGTLLGAAVREEASASSSSSSSSLARSSSTR